MENLIQTAFSPSEIIWDGYRDSKRIGGSRRIKYTIVIQWSEEDDCFVVFLPEFEDVMQPVTHGDSYEEACQNAREVLGLLTESAIAEGKPLPEPQKLFQAA